MSTIELIRLRDLDFGMEIRDAALVDDDRLLITTADGDGRLAEMGPGILPSTPLFDFRDLRARMLRAIGATEADKLPQPVIAPRVAASARGGVAVVNTEDINLYAVPLDGRAPPEMVVCGWGQHDPILRFSTDGSYVAMLGDSLYLTDARTLDTVEHAADAFDWHPAENRMLVLEWTRLSWIEAGTGGVRPVGTLELPERIYDPVVGLALSADCAECVVAYNRDRLEWWSIDGAPRLLDARRTYDGPERIDGIDHVVSSPDRRLLALVSGPGMRMWDVRTREPAGETVPGVSWLSFSPSGRRVATVAYQGEWDVLATLWEVRG